MILSALPKIVIPTKMLVDIWKLLFNLQMESFALFFIKCNFPGFVSINRNTRTIILSQFLLAALLFIWTFERSFPAKLECIVHFNCAFQQISKMFLAFRRDLNYQQHISCCDICSVRENRKQFGLLYVENRTGKSFHLHPIVSNHWQSDNFKENKRK